jgi:hypothetical protein
MSKQNYSNHTKYYAPHHFVLLPALVILIFIGIRNSILSEENSLTWLLFTIVTLCLLYLAIMLRQHYALGNQNRIVRLEFKLRYFELFGTRSDVVEKQLSFDQIAALRFANDKEFIELLDRALTESLKGDKIKKSIKDWQADHERV